MPRTAAMMERGDHVTQSNLVERCRAGDDDAAEALCRRWQPRVFDVAARIVGALEEGEAITQEALLRTLVAVRRREGPPVRSFGAYAMRTARNLAIDQVRHQATVRDAPLPPPTPVPPPRGEGPELHRLRGLVNDLEPELRQIVELRYVEEQSYAEMARTLEMSKNGVFARHARALDALRRRLLGGDR